MIGGKDGAPEDPRTRRLADDGSSDPASVRSDGAELASGQRLPAAPPPPAPLAGRPSLGPYVLVRELGRGGMGVVYEGWRADLQARFAVKVLSAATYAGPEAVERFRREAQAAARLRHPGIVAVVDAGVEDGVPYYAMEFVEGTGLDAALDDPARAGLASPAAGAAGGRPRRGLAARDAARIALEVAEAIAYAHGQGIVHRDLKPANVILERAGRPRVVDFGLAKLVGPAVDAAATPATRSGARLTRTGAILGTLAYMPPEQADGASDAVDARSDVYALGATLYEMTTGRPPFAADSEAALLGQVLLGVPARLRAVVPDLPVELETIVLKAMEREPRRRYPQAADLAADLRRFLAGEPIGARPPSTAHRALAWARRRHLALAVAVLLGAMGIAAGTFAWRAHAAEAHRALLRTQRIARLRELAGTCVDATLTLRRAGVPMSQAEAEHLPRILRAVEELERTEPGLAEPQYHLGRLNRALLRFDQALVAQERALARDPDLACGRYEHALLLSRLHADRVAELRAGWRRAEGARLAAGGAFAGTGGGAVRSVRACPAGAALVAGDGCAQGLTTALLADLDRLAAVAAATGTPAGGRKSTGEGKATGDGKAAELAPSPAMVEFAAALRILFAAGVKAGMEEGAHRLRRALELDPALEEAYEALAQIEWAEGRPEGAIALYSEGLAVDAGYVPFWLGRGDARTNLAIARGARGEDPADLYAGAVADYDRALELEPGCAQTWVARGTARLNWCRTRAERGQEAAELTAAAEADLGRAVERRPDLRGAWLTRGILRLNLASARMDAGQDPSAQLDAAEADLGHALALSAADAETHLARALLRMQRGLWGKEHGQDPSAAFVAAEADCARALELDPTRAESWRCRAMVHANGGRARTARGLDPTESYTRAEADFARAVELAPDSGPGWSGRGALHLNWGAWVASRGEDPAAAHGRAAECFSRAIALNPMDAEAWTRRGIVHANGGLASSAHGRNAEPQFAAADEDLSRGLELNPRLAEARTARAIVRSHWGVLRARSGGDPEDLFRRAEEDLAVLLAAGGETLQWWVRRGDVYTNWGAARAARGQEAEDQFARAEADFGRALERDPRLAQAWVGRGNARMNRAVCRERQGKGMECRELYAAAEADCLRAVAVVPDFPDGWRKLALVRMNWGEYCLGKGEDPRPIDTRCAEACDRALRLNPQDAEVWLFRGQAAMCSGSWVCAHGGDAASLFDAARQDFDRAIGVNPRYAEALENRARVHAQRGNWTEAVADFEAVLRIVPTATERLRAPLHEARQRAGEAAPQGR